MLKLHHVCPVHCCLTVHTGFWWYFEEKGRTLRWGYFFKDRKGWFILINMPSKLRGCAAAKTVNTLYTGRLAPCSLTCDSVCQIHLCMLLWQKWLPSTLQPVCCTKVQQSLTNVHQVSWTFKACDVFPTIRHVVNLCIEMSIAFCHMPAYWHTHTHTVLTAIFPGEPGLAGWYVGILTHNIWYWCGISVCPSVTWYCA